MKPNHEQTVRCPELSQEKPSGDQAVAWVGSMKSKHVGAIAQAATQIIPVVDAGLDEVRQFLQLDPADGRLDVQRLEIVAQVRIDVFVVVALGQLAQLPLEAFAAGVVHAAGAPAIAPPIAEALDDGFELEALHDVDRAALAHGHMMGRIKRLRGKIAEAARQLAVVSAAQGVAIVLDEPQLVLVAEVA